MSLNRDFYDQFPLRENTFFFKSESLFCFSFSPSPPLSLSLSLSLSKFLVVLCMVRDRPCLALFMRRCGEDIDVFLKWSTQYFNVHG